MARDPVEVAGPLGTPLGLAQRKGVGIRNRQVNVEECDFLVGHKCTE